MSWEVWGTPPDPEPARCPMCGEESHEEGCELGKMQARAIRAERELALRIERQHAAENANMHLAADRDEADRQAGVLGRQVDRLKEEVGKFNDFKRRAKEQWGADQNMSFDLVWREATLVQRLVKIRTRALCDIQNAPIPQMDLHAVRAMNRLKLIAQRALAQPALCDCQSGTCESKADCRMTHELNEGGYQ